MAIPTIVDSVATDPGGTGSTITPVLPTHAANDGIIIWIPNTGNTNYAGDPAGWSRVDQRSTGNPSNGIVGTWLYRRVLPGDTLPLADPVVNLETTVTRHAHAITVRGADLEGMFTLLEWGARGFATGTSNPIRPPTVTTLAPEMLVLIGYGQRAATDAPDQSGYTQDEEIITSGTLVSNLSHKTVADQNTGLSNQDASPTSGARWVAGILCIPSADYVYYRSGTQATATGTSVTPSLPPGTSSSDWRSNKDLVVATVEAAGTPTISPQVGGDWTEITGFANTTSGNGSTVRKYWAHYDGTLDLQFNRSTSGEISVCLTTYRNTHQSIPIGAVNNRQNASSTTSTWDALTRTNDRSTMQATCVADATPTYTSPSGWTERMDGLGITCADQVFNAAGSTASAAFTLSAASPTLVGLVEVQGLNASLPLTLTLSDDGNVLSDGMVKIVGAASVLADSLEALAETLAQLMSYELALADSEAANWADAHNLLLSQFLALADDSDSLADAALLGLGLNEALDDTLALSDAFGFTLGLSVNLVDSVSLSDSLMIGHGLLPIDSLGTLIPSQPTLMFLDPGGDAVGATGYFNTITATSGGTVSYDTSQKVIGIGSYKSEVTNGTAEAYAETESVLGTQQHCRVSFYFRYDSVPTTTTTILQPLDVDRLDLFRLNITPQGAGVIIEVVDDFSTTYSGIIELLPNTWNRISFSYIEHALDDTDVKVYVNGVLEISVTAMPSGNTSPPLPFLRYGWISNPGANRICWFDQIYVDAGDDLSDPGNILITAKLPASVNENNWDTTGGTGAVDERPLDTANFKQHAASTGVRQTYTLQDAATGDADISSSAVIGYMGWAWAKKSAGDDGDLPALIVNNTAQPIILLTAAKLFRFSVVSSSYPSHAAGIGMRSNEENADSFMYECGVIVAARPVSRLSDSFALQLGAEAGPDLTLELSDSLPARSDSLALSYGLLTADTLDAQTDALEVQGEGLLSFADMLEALSDEESHNLGLEIDFADAIALGDAIDLQVGYEIDLSDLIALDDSETHTLDYYLTLADDSNLLADFHALELGHEVALSDDLNLLADSIALLSGHEIALADAFILSDIHALELSHLLTFTDSIVLTDNYEQDLVSTVAEITEDLADDINVLADSLALGIGLVFSDNADNLTDAEITTLGYSLDFADTVNLSDTSSLELQHLLAIDDAFSLTDTQSSILDYGVSLSDSINNLTDAVDIQLGQLLALSDSVDNLADSHTETIAHLLEFGDALILTDSVLLGYGLSVSEDINLLIDAIETSAPQGPLREVGLTDAIDLSDAVALELRYLLEVADDAATLNDALALTEGLLTSFSDSILLTDAVAATLDHLRPLADSFALSDAAQIHLGYSLDLSDSVALDDSTSLRLGHELATSDSITLSDAIDLAEGYLIAFSDSLSLADAEAVRLDYLTALADSLALNDAIQLRLGHELSVSDTVVLSDGIAEGLSHHLELTDNAALLADSEAETLGLALILAENGPVFTDSVEFLSAWLLRLSDAITLTDSLTKFGEGFLPLADSLLLSDDVAVELRGPDLEAALSDSLTFDDAISLALGDELQIQITLSDVIVLTDHYFDLRFPYTLNLNRSSVVPSRARTTTITSERLTIVPARATTIE